MVEKPEKIKGAAVHVCIRAQGTNLQLSTGLEVKAGASPIAFKVKRSQMHEALKALKAALQEKLEMPIFLIIDFQKA